MTDTAEPLVRSSNQRLCLLRDFCHVRATTEALTYGLSDADTNGQSMPDASPTKWHLAHTTWFFETFVLAAHDPGYRPFDPSFNYLFNSYYEAVGSRNPRASRGLITRPSLQRIFEYRAHVDLAISRASGAFLDAVRKLIVLGCHHEQQHQELIRTDLLHLFAQNPLFPSINPDQSAEVISQGPMTWIDGEQGPVQIGHEGDSFAFDCESPRHTTWLARHAISNRLVTNIEWLEFINDGGYAKPEHWLSDGWTWVKQNGIEAPLYWLRNSHGSWGREFTSRGVVELDPNIPVSHVSYYEADAFARWAGARLPTEAEWESAAARTWPDMPRSERSSHSGLADMFGRRWQWTGSAFLPYPGFRPPAGAVGEYNGKFMSGQFVLRGGSHATPANHTRPTYRNFFYPHQRWQFTGLRLAKDM